MTLAEDIRRNWRMDVRGMCQEIQSLYRIGFPAWTVRLADGKFGVAIPCSSDYEMNEKFASVSITNMMSVTPPASAGEQVKALVLLTDATNGADAFSQLCEDFVRPGDNGASRVELLNDPTKWWRKWKELLGNKNVDPRVYDVLGELCAYRALVRAEMFPVWNGPDHASYDIETPAGFFEVKSSTVRDHKEISIHSHFQLDPPGGKPLAILFCQFEAVAGLGETIDEVVEDLRKMGVDTDEINEKLSRLGFEPGRSSRREAYTLHAILRYEVTGDFPRITAESFVNGALPRGVSKVTYTVDLDAMPATRIEQ